MARSGLGWTGTIALYAILIVASTLFMIPFLFAVGTSLKPPSLLHVVPPLLFPPLSDAHPENYSRIFNIPYVPYDLFYRNTVVITLGAITGAVISATASAYGFARFRWPGRDF